jgi:ectoine hydroxylase-related dioxygenase (phytanoyl-CoA dioxygenase family)
MHLGTPSGSALPGAPTCLHAGEYDTGLPPYQAWWKPGDPPNALRKADGVHCCDHAIHALTTHPAIGRLIAELTGARKVRIWGSQAIHKPPTAGADVKNCVGWHQDNQYWEKHRLGEVLTVWIAVSDVTADAGPVRFVRGSNTWGRLTGGDFNNGDLKLLQQGMLKGNDRTWEEVPAILAPGALSVHNRYTIHGSGPNCSARPRLSIAAHYFTERSETVPGSNKIAEVEKMGIFPELIYQA